MPITLAQEAKAVLASLSTHARRRLSQNFMISDRAIGTIVSALELKPGERVLEIGPGLGFLTRAIAATGAEVLAVEKDKRFCAYLRERYAGMPNIRVHEGDALDFAYADYLAEGPAKCSGNLPYQISSPIIETIQPFGALWRDAIFTFQKDFARRMAARESTPDRSSLGVWLGLHARVEFVAEFKKTDFFPAPKVDSTLVRIRFYDRPLYPEDAGEFLRAAIRSSFQERRKNLLNGLEKGTELSKAALTKVLREADIDSALRPEALSLDDWVRLGGRIAAHKSQK